jgi:hypothetical protein
MQEVNLVSYLITAAVACTFINFTRDPDRGSDSFRDGSLSGGCDDRCAGARYRHCLKKSSRKTCKLIRRQEKYA